MTDRANRPPLWVFGLLAFLYVPVAVAFGSSAWMMEDREQMLQRVTDLSWPAGTTQVFLVDEEKPEDNPYYIEAHVRVPVDAVPGMLGDARWVPAQASDISFMPEADRLPAGLETPTGGALWLARGDHTGSNPYALLLEAETGRMWMRVDYR